MDIELPEGLYAYGREVRKRLDPGHCGNPILIENPVYLVDEVATRFRLEIGGVRISGSFSEPVSTGEPNVESVHGTLLDYGTRETEAFLSAVRAKLGPALSAKYLSGRV